MRLCLQKTAANGEILEEKPEIKERRLKSIKSQMKIDFTGRQRSVSDHHAHLFHLFMPKIGKLEESR